MFNFFKKKQNQNLVLGNRGYLSVYGLEDIYNFIGEDRINNRIEELSTKATMGIRLEDLVCGNNKEGFYDKGPINCMALILNYFKEPDIIEFLFDKLKDFNEQSYMENTSWSIKRLERINSLIQTFSNDDRNDKSTIDQLKELNVHLNYNYYFVDYHFFLIGLYRILIISKDNALKEKVNATTLIDYLPKLQNIKQSLVDLNIWVSQGLGNSVLSALEEYCQNKEQSKFYLKYFEDASDEGWRF